MMKFIATILGISAVSCLMAQEPDFSRHDVTPENVSMIGGLNTYRDSNYIMVNTKLVYAQRLSEASESRSIRQKYPEWEIYSFDSVKIISNATPQWNVVGASPYGFTILDDKTVVYVDSKNHLRSNSKVLNQQFKLLFDKKYSYLYPYMSPDSKRIYFSSNMPGGSGGFDIWYIEKDGFGWSRPRNAGEPINSISNEMNTLQLNDSVMVFSSGRTVGSGVNILFLDLQTNKLFDVNSHVNSVEDEVFMCSLDSVSLILSSRNALGNDKVYSVRWYQERRAEQVVENSSKILVPQVVDMSAKANEAAPVRIADKAQDEANNMSVTRYFGLAQYELTPQMSDSLVGIANKIKSEKDQNVLICGNASPDGTDYINMMLSYFRANTASDKLIEQKVPKESIYRVYGGEYLFQETHSARRFSIFALNLADIPNQLAVIKMDNKNQLNDILTRFNIDADEAQFIKSELSAYLPVDNENLVIVPVADLVFPKEGDTLFSIAAKYGITLDQIKKVNNLKNETILTGQVIYIPMPAAE